MINTIVIIIGVWSLLWVLAIGGLWVSNWIEDRRRPMYRCHVTGATVRPMGIGTPITVSGMRYAWWRCPVCDRNERQRHEAGYDGSHPGVHLVALDEGALRPVWRGRRAV